MSYQRVLYDIKRRERLHPEETWGATTEARPAPTRNVGFAPLPRPEPAGAGVYHFGDREMTEAERWAHSGDWHSISDSTNVDAIAYNKVTERLYIEFKNWLPSMPIGMTGGRGSVYMYEGVTFSEAVSFYNASSSGVWIWDTLRVRGSWSEHKKPYALTRRPDTYTPRMAVTQNGEEWFLMRQQWSYGRNTLIKSELPERIAPDFKQIALKAIKYRSDLALKQAREMQSIGDGIVQPITQPNRGTPNRGNQAKPNRGN